MKDSSFFIQSFSGSLLAYRNIFNSIKTYSLQWNFKFQFENSPNFNLVYSTSLTTQKETIFQDLSFCFISSVYMVLVLFVVRQKIFLQLILKSRVSNSRTTTIHLFLCFSYSPIKLKIKIELEKELWLEKKTNQKNLVFYNIF